MIGKILILSILVLSFIAVFFNKYSTKDKVDKRVNYVVYLTTLLSIGAAGYLIYLFLTNAFEYSYVWSYSSRDLPILYKISGLWAGQQGSFLLWLVIHAIAGAWICYYRLMDRASITVFLLLQSLLVILILCKNPFDLSGVVQADGAGLNPLLQNLWMVSHPPLLFVGYALLAIPFSYVMGALFTSDFSTWLEKSKKATVIAWCFLGTGIMLGAYWAYDTLGWGGYWGWDPVENSSLVPWLLATALIHFEFGVKHNRGMFKPLVLLSLISYIFVIYGTFLTRSGVLGDFSVHSFSGGNIGLILAGVVSLLVMISLLVMGIKWENIPGGELYESVSSPDFFISAGMLIIVVMVILITFGMSLPFLSGLIDKGQSVQPAFYNKTLAPLFIGLILLMGVYFWKVRKASLSTILVHGGVVVMALGIFISGLGADSKMEKLEINQPIEFVNKQIKYQGVETTETTKSHIFNVNGEVIKALTKLNKHGQDAAKAPAILHTLGGDMYFAPAMTSEPAPEITLSKSRAAFENGLLLSFKEAGKMTMSETGGMVVQAVINVTDGKTAEEVTLSIAEDKGGFKSVPITVLNNHYRMELRAINGNFSEIKVTTVDLEKEKLAGIQTEISWKPLIWLVWLGSILVFVGGMCNLLQRQKQ